MTLFRTVAPATEPVTLAEAKAYLRLQHDSEDALLAGLVRAAREEVERSTGAALIDQHWRMTLDAWPDSVIRTAGRVGACARPIFDLFARRRTSPANSASSLSCCRRR